MKGWEFTAPKQPLRFVEKEDPVIKPGFAIIDIKACGLCHSDVAALEDETWLAMMDPPIILGHEISGVISEVGEGVTDFKVGDRVGVFPMSENNLTSPGYKIDGGYGTTTMVPVEQLVKLPDNLSFAYGASLTVSKSF